MGRCHKATKVSEKKKAKRINKAQEEKEMKMQTTSDQAAIKAVKWFRGEEGSLRLEILRDGESEESFLTTAVDRGMTFAQRLRSATTSISAAEI